MKQIHMLSVCIKDKMKRKQWTLEKLWEFTFSYDLQTINSNLIYLYLIATLNLIVKKLQHTN